MTSRTGRIVWTPSSFQTTALAGADSYLDRVEVLIAEMLRDEGVRLPGARREALRRRADELGLPALLDALRCLQIEWAALVCAEPSESLYTALDVCLLRFGALADRAGDADTLDCEDMVEALGKLVTA